MDLSGSVVLVVGLGVTGMACVEHLAGRTKALYATDSRTEGEEALARAKAAEKLGAVFAPPDRLAGLPRIDLAALSPGLAPDAPFLSVLKARTECRMMGEIELAARLARGRLAAVTGTNGKTTATLALGALLRQAAEDVRVVGNIGEPFIGRVWDSTPATLFALEVSSYQLETAETLAPEAAAVLNVTEDHMGRHKTMEAYARAKAMLLKNVPENGRAVLNLDDEWTRGMGDGVRGRVAWFSASGNERADAFIRGGDAVVEGRAMALDDLAPGMKGCGARENLLAALLLAGQFGVGLDLASKALAGFHPPAHRLETVAEWCGWTIVNDSKATNVASTLAALRSYEGSPVSLILCGDDKGLDYAPLVRFLKDRPEVEVWFSGSGLRRAEREMREELDNEVRWADGFEDLLKALLKRPAREGGETVLFSPSSSSFDRFRNFEERGEAFRLAARKIIGETSNENDQI